MGDRVADTSHALFQGERQREIVALALQDGRVEVAELSTRFGVTTETIRRDLSELQDQRIVRRVHGGAVPWESIGFEPMLSVRNELHTAEKRRLGRRAVQELPEGGTCIIDSGSTLTHFASAIPRDRAVQVVTNSLKTAQILAEGDGMDVTVIGGGVRKNTFAMVDAVAVAAVEQLRVDTLFISCDGFSVDNGLSTPYAEEAALKRAMIRAARRVVALCDHTKSDSDHLMRFAEWREIDLFITNDELDARVIADIRGLGPAVALA